MPRPLRREERALVTAILNRGGKRHAVLSSLDGILVEEMADGGMGSLRFVLPRSRNEMTDATPAFEFHDDDGVLVSAVLNFDHLGQLFELDIWKTDFSPVRSLRVRDS